MVPYIRKIKSLAGKIMINFIREDLDTLKTVLNTPTIRGPKSRLHIGQNVSLQDTLFNTVSGHIYIGDYSFFGEKCMLLTGTHDYNKTLLERQFHPESGNDIHIGKGVWICSGSIILGNTKIADHVVIAAGSVVTKSCLVPGIYGGIPSRLLKPLDQNLPHAQTDRCDL